MKYFRVIYQKIDCREVLVESSDDTMTETEAEELFLRNFEQYDGESDDHDADGGSMDVLTVDEIDEDGDDI
jgi:hypothetical protein